jgi:hypothetical protein
MAEASNLDAALKLAIAGLPVLPVRITYNEATGRFDKQSCVAGWKTRATTDPAQIREFWRQFPDAVPGIALGQAGLGVVDADRHGGPDGVSAFRQLTDQHGLPAGAVCIETAGFGEHWVFRNISDDPLGNGEGVLPGGINMRGYGGFVVVQVRSGPTAGAGASRTEHRGCSKPLQPGAFRSFRSGSRTGSALRRAVRPVRRSILPEPNSHESQAASAPMRWPR